MPSSGGVLRFLRNMEKILCLTYERSGTRRDRKERTLESESAGSISLSKVESDMVLMLIQLWAYWALRVLGRPLVTHIFVVL